MLPALPGNKNCNHNMTLRELTISQSAIVTRVGGEGSLRQHFLDMGVIPGSVLTLKKYAPMGDPMQLIVAPSAGNDPAAAMEMEGYELTLRLADIGAKLLVDTIRRLEKGDCPRTPQNGQDMSYHPMLKKDMGQVDWTMPARDIVNLARGLYPWPSAYTCCRGKTLKIWEAQVEAEPDAENPSRLPGKNFCPGSVVQVTKQSLKIQTGKGLLSVRELQLEGKKRMPVDAFLRGYQLEKGALLQ